MRNGNTKRENARQNEKQLHIKRKNGTTRERVRKDEKELDRMG